MDYSKKALKWQESFSKEKDSKVKCIFESEGEWRLADNTGYILLDSMYYCIQRNGEKITEYSWKRGSGEKPLDKSRILIKEDKKLILIQKEDVFGFGFGDKEDISIVLFIRHNIAAKLFWSKSSNNRVNYMCECNCDNPESLDCLVEFMDRKQLWQCEDDGGGE